MISGFLVHCKSRASGICGNGSSDDCNGAGRYAAGCVLRRWVPRRAPVDRRRYASRRFRVSACMVRWGNEEWKDRNVCRQLLPMHPHVCARCAHAISSPSFAHAARKFPVPLSPFPSLGRFHFFPEHTLLAPEPATSGLRPGLVEKNG